MWNNTAIPSMMPDALLQFLADAHTLENQLQINLSKALGIFFDKDAEYSVKLFPAPRELLVRFEITDSATDEYPEHVTFELPGAVAFPQDDFDIANLQAYVQAHYSELIDDSNDYFKMRDDIDWLDEDIPEYASPSPAVYGYVTRPGVPKPLPVDEGGELL